MAAGSLEKKEGWLLEVGTKKKKIFSFLFGRLKFGERREETLVFFLLCLVLFKKGQKGELLLLLPLGGSLRSQARDNFFGVSTNGSPKRLRW